MKRFIEISTRATTVLLVAILAAGCVFEKEDPLKGGEMKSVMVQLGVSTDGGMISTKADNVITMEGAEGTSDENIIKTLRIYAYTGQTGSEKLCGYLFVDNVPAATSETKVAYMMDIRLPYSQMSSVHDVTFVAIANAEGMKNASNLDISELGRHFDGTFIFKGNISYETLAGIQYSIPDQSFGSGMPMYCKTEPIEIDLSQVLQPDGTAINAEEHPDHTLVKNVPINLTRSLAKIEVYAAEDAGTGSSAEKNTSIEVTGVKIYNAVKDGYLFEGGSIENPTIESDISMISANVSVGHAVSEAQASTGTYTKVTGPYYMAENFKGTPATFSYGMIEAGQTLDVTGGETILKIDYIVGSKPYSGYVKMPQIQRNTYYKVLARMASNGELAITFAVKPWEIVNNNINVNDHIRN